MSKIVILNGHPATGKTQFLIRLLEKISIPVVSKDDIKELIGKDLPDIDLELSKELGKASFELMHHFINQLTLANANFVVEAPLKPLYESPYFLELFNKFQPSILQIIFHCSPETIEKRLEARAMGRHRVHLDSNRDYTVTENSLREYGFLDVPSIKVIVATDQNKDETHEKLKEVIKFLGK